MNFLTKREAAAYSPLALAFLGDSVYDTLIREYLLKKSNMPAGKLHAEKIKFVCAEFQSEMYSLIDNVLTESEHASNVLPWFALKNEIGIKIKYIEFLISS